jgi:hypothetical protein
MKSLSLPLALVLASAALMATVRPTCAQPDRSAAETTVGVMSEEVVRRRLEMQGYSRIGSLTRRDTAYDVQAVKDGRTVRLEVNAMTGEIREKAD